ncbi:hypothetical protein CPC735_039900 [Coccidioides posadasii C735 delta SOWgp]|uniref:MGS207 protein n=2 Tax=Coccidioides posadasii TaxID=199306 RepID=A0A0J6EUG1_COCPO|nr:hypothetical protein CPC735_039900 [Coccidioides posadasii C735 delta SOWgp]EER28726.1 hypothetical protein CPC735_039900 [Coccidioides posadasii C735 delta SOWgp]KMM64161.1 hypothetical protein CPAG_00513 [Coccidioides posadasii RMSCC 3488]|eukprot:XP_003070871.1 hypothetical protein CPC735_039900 [Coccidioides posadasii C735 delta SOWgp]
MLSQLSSLIPSFRQFSQPPAEHTVRVPVTETHNVETAQEKAARALKHLIKLNHANFSILYNGLLFYNHMPHLLSTAYLLGGDSEHLNRLYESESKELEQWVDSPGEIGDIDWGEFLGKREYQRAYLDFFEDEVVRCGYDWKKVAQEYLCAHKMPLVNSLISGFGHPLIHLGYAYEMDNREVAMEALAMAASCYGDIHKYLDNPSYLRSASSYKTTSLLEIINRVQNDKAFDGLFETTAVANFDVLFKSGEAPLLNHWAAWDVADATEQFEAIQRFATALLVNSGAKPHNFFFVHLLTTTHALRIIFPSIPAQYHVNLLRQWWLLALGLYIAELRPQFNASSINAIKDYDLEGRDWNWVSQHALHHKMSTSAHYIKPLRTMREAEKTWADREFFYLRAALKFIDEFQGWGGL